MKVEIGISLVEDVFGMRKFEIVYIKIIFFGLGCYQTIFFLTT